MKTSQIDWFKERWNHYFPAAEPPIVFFYANDPDDAEKVAAPEGHRCLMHDLIRVRRGEALAFDKESVGCEGGKRYTGFTSELRPDFDYFLSCGIPGEVEGERYKKTPALVEKIMTHAAPFRAPAKYIVFKRWDRLSERDQPEAVVFFGRGDILSGLFTLANFDEVDLNAVIAPFCAGCASIVYHPCLQGQSETPKAVLGMFDVSARPYVPADTLSFSIPWAKFECMMENMDESFLITKSWKKVQARLRSDQS
ncbi:MAG: DUF169 domain-containing protein [Candidatus Omnitrophica bacterium]|nr:DUF169 domain-containing protein [Candidatus Omnitrophota bacterium]